MRRELTRPSLLKFKKREKYSKMDHLEDQKTFSNSHFKLINWLVKPESNELVDRSKVVKIESKAMETLVYLSNHSSRPVSQEELIQKVWRNTVVSATTVRRVIKNLRRDLVDDATNPTYIKTVPKRGYQIICDVNRKKIIQRYQNTRVVSMLLAILITIVYLADNKLNDKTLYSLPYQQITNLAGREITPTLSPDGSSMIFAYLSPEDGQYRLMWRSLEHLTNFTIVGGDNAFNPVFSPDGENIAFIRMTNDSCQISIAKFLRTKKSIENRVTVGQCKRDRFNFIHWKDDSILYFENSDSASNKSAIFEFNLQSLNSSKISYDHKDLNNVVYIASRSDQREHLYVQRKGVLYELWRQADDSPTKLIHTFNDRINGLKYCGKKHKPTIIKSDGIWQIDSKGELKKLEFQTRDEVTYLGCSSGSNKLVFSSSQLNTNIIMATVPTSFSVVNDQQVKVEYLNRTTKNNRWPMFANTDDKVAFLSDQAGKWDIYGYMNGEVSLLYANESLSTKPYPVLWSPDDSKLLLILSEGLSIYDVSNKRLQSVTNTDDNAITVTFNAEGNGLYYVSANDHALYYVHLKNGKKQKVADLNARDVAIHPISNEIYFTKVDQDGLWHYDPSNSIERLIISEIHNSSIFIVFDNGVYFNQRVSSPSGVYYFDFATKELTNVLPNFDSESFYQFSVSHDQSKVVFTVLDNYQSDIYLISTDL